MPIPPKFLPQALTPRAGKIILVCAFGLLNLSFLCPRIVGAQRVSPLSLTNNAAKKQRPGTVTAQIFPVQLGHLQAGHLAREKAQNSAMVAGLRGQLLHEVLPPSPLLKNRRASAWIYLPPGYKKSKVHYPVAYLFHGAPGQARDLLVNAQAHRVAESLIVGGKVSPFIMVTFDAFGPGGLNDVQNYLDDADSSFKMESFITRTLVPWMDTHYRTKDNPDARALIGFSAGGYGAANLGFKHPDLWRVIASVSGFFDPTDDSSNMSRILGPKSSLWDDNSPLLRARELPEGTRLHFFMACGKKDPLFHEFKKMQRELRARGADYEAEEGDGDHDWSYLHSRLFDVFGFCDRRWKELGRQDKGQDEGAA